MKKFLLPLVVLSAFFVASCDKGEEEPEETVVELTEEEKAELAKLDALPKEYTGVFIKHTGTKCPPCGSWGWDATAAAINQFDDRAVVVTAYGNYNNLSELFISQHATQLGSADKVTGIPSFHANGVKCATSGSTAEALISSTLSSADVQFTLSEEKDLVAGAAVKWSVENNRAVGTYRVGFFEEAKGEYYATVWFDESKLKGYQYGHTAAEPEHKHVMRTAASYNVYGDKLGANIAKNTVIDVDFDIEFPTSVWKPENTEATVVIWRKIGDTHLFVNASQATFE